MNIQFKENKARYLKRVKARADGGGTPGEKATDPDLGYSLIPKSRYVSKEFMELEWEHLWRKVWNMAGPEQLAPEPGDFFTTELGRESFIMVRQPDRSFKGFYNVCLHRGNQLCQKSTTGQAASFRCHYHHWEWNTNGSLKNVPDVEKFPQGAPAEKLGLREVKVDTWGGQVWFNMDLGAQSLRDYLNVIPQHLDPYHFEQQKLVRNITVEWDCNWKASVDAFNETYHVQGIHPELMPWVEDYDCQIDCYDKHNRYLVPFWIPSVHYPDQKTLSDVLRFMLTEVGLNPADFEGRALDVREAVQRAKRAKENDTVFPYKELNDDQLSDDYHYMIFPNVTMNIYAEAVMLFRSRPHPTDPNKMFFDLMNFAHVVDMDNYEEPEYRVYKHGEISLGLILDQDAANLPNVQDGMNSAAFDGLYIGDLELRIRHFHKTLVDYVDPDGKLGV